MKSAERELNMQKRRRKKNNTLKSVERALNTQKRRETNSILKSAERALNTQKRRGKNNIDISRARAQQAKIEEDKITRSKEYLNQSGFKNTERNIL